MKNNSLPMLSDEEFLRRHDRIREAMSKRGLECLIVVGDGNQGNVRYISGYADIMGHSYVLFTKEKSILLYSMWAQAPQRIPGYKLHVTYADWMGPEPGETLAALVKQEKIERAKIGLVGSSTRYRASMPFEHYNSLVRELPQASFEICTGLLEDLRIVKSQEELAIIRKSGEFTDIALEALVQAVKPDVTERDLILAVRRAGLENGFEAGVILGSTPTSNPSLANPWWYPSPRKIQKGDIILNELLVGYGGYHSDGGRPIFLGKAPKDYEELFKLALSVYNRILAALKPGNNKDHIIEAGMPIIEAGLTIQPPLIHGAGLSVEAPHVGLPYKPYVVPIVDATFRKGMTVHVEPAPCTIDYKKGVFISNMVEVTDSGGKSVVSYPMDLIEL